MPNRIIRDSARFSETLDALSAEGERMFWRLTTVADDFGRFHADPRVMLANCFPLKVDTWKSEMVAKWLQELVDVDAVSIYEVSGKRYGFFKTWDLHQQRRAAKSKFPDPQLHADARTCMHAHADSLGIGIGIENENGSESRSRRARKDDPLVFDPEQQRFVGITEVDLQEWAAAYPTVNVQGEIVRAAAWRASKRGQKRSYQSDRGFLVNWLKREHDEAPATAMVPTTGVAATDAQKYLKL